MPPIYLRIRPVVPSREEAIAHVAMVLHVWKVFIKAHPTAKYTPPLFDLLSKLIDHELLSQRCEVQWFTSVLNIKLIPGLLFVE